MTFGFVYLVPNKLSAPAETTPFECTLKSDIVLDLFALVRVLHADLSLGPTVPAIVLPLEISLSRAPKKPSRAPKKPPSHQKQGFHPQKWQDYPFPKLQVFECHVEVPCYGLLHFQRQKHATIPSRNTIPRIPPTRTGVEKKEELDATAVPSATAPVPVFEADSSGEVVDGLRAGLTASIAVAEIRAGVATSITVDVGNPALENSLLMLSAVSLPASS